MATVSHWDAEVEALWDAEMESLSAELADKRWDREMELWNRGERDRELKEREQKKQKKEEPIEEPIEEQPLWTLSDAMEIGSSILALMEREPF